MINIGDYTFLGWIVNQLATLLVTIDKMRTAADAEYAIELSLDTNNPVVLKLGGEVFMDEDYFLEPGFLPFPRYSYGSKAERALLEVAQDILHSLDSRLALAL